MDKHTQSERYPRIAVRSFGRACQSRRRSLTPSGTWTKVALLCLGIPLAQIPATSAQSRSLAITEATLIDGTGAPARERVTILIRDGRIVQVVDSDQADLPEDMDVVDAAGKFVIPGLSDMHVHLSSGGLLPTDAAAMKRLLRQFLFYGVTTIFNVGGTGGSLDDVLRLRERQDSGEILAPHCYATGGLLTVPGSHPIATIMRVPEGVDPAEYDWSQRGVWVVRSPDDIPPIVERLASSGMHGVKIVIESGPSIYGDDHPQMSAEVVDSVVRAATQRGLPVFAHATSIDELELALTAHVRGVMHLVNDPVAPEERLFALMAEQKSYYVPTLSLFVWTGTWGDPSETLSDPFLRAGVEGRVLASLIESPLSPKQAPSEADWSWRRALLRSLEAAHRAGVRIVAGSDTGNPFVFPGYSIHQELELMVEAGLSPMEALIAATAMAAEMIGEEDEFGTIRPGLRADLLVLTKDPLQDIRNTRTLEIIVQDGRQIERGDLLGDG